MLSKNMRIPFTARNTALMTGLIALVMASTMGGFARWNSLKRAKVAAQQSLQSEIKKGSSLAATGDYAGALKLFQTLQPRSAGIASASQELTILNNLGGCQMGLARYSDAIRTFLKARRTAEKLKQPVILAQINGNLASLYVKMNNLPAAANSARAALESSAGVPVAQRVPILFLLAHVSMLQGNISEGEAAYKSCIGLAENNHLGAQQAAALEYFSYDMLSAGQTGKASELAQKALSIRASMHLPGAETAYWHLGRAAAAQGRTKLAFAYYENAFEQARNPKSTLPVWALYRDRGKLRLESGELDGAVSDLRIALQASRLFNVVPTEDNRVASEDKLSETSAVFVEAANRLALTRSNQEPLISEAFDANQRGREASVRALVPQKSGWRQRLSPTYAKDLARLQVLERAQALDLPEAKPEELATVRSAVEEMQVSAGLAYRDGNVPAKERVARALRDDSALLSFSLGDRQSWLWVQTTAGLRLYTLPDKTAIAKAQGEFSQAVETDAPDVAQKGQALYRLLFAAAEPQIANKHRWLLSLDRDLFRVPFAALVTRVQSGKPVYLAEKHITQLTSGAFMLSDADGGTFTSGKFVGVGDPVYNHADPRAHRAIPGFFSLLAAAPSVHLARLLGSGKEIETSAQAWDQKQSSVLVGLNATKSNLSGAVASHPAVLHLATHVIESPLKFHAGMIGLTSQTGDEPELLTAEEIVAYTEPANLVVLSGCSSGRAGVSVASGLMGLTRAWVAAGAKSVVATLWATGDDGGTFFKEFYTQLKRPGMSAAEALRMAQLAMLRSGTFRAHPQYWATYFTVGNYR